MGWMALAAAGVGLATEMMKDDEKGAGAQQGIGTLALAQAMKHGQTEAMTREMHYQPSEATSAKERGEYLMRMLQAIQNNETEGASAMDSVAASLMRDMQAGTGRIQEEPVVQPLSTESPGPGAFSPQERYDVAVAAFGGQPSHTQIIEEPTEEEEKERSSFVNLPDSCF